MRQITTCNLLGILQVAQVAVNQASPIPPMGMGGEGGGVLSVQAGWSAASLFDGAPIKRNHLQPSEARLAISLEFCKSLLILKDFQAENRAIVVYVYPWHAAASLSPLSFFFSP
jgi:hypothetical protein